MTNPVFAHISSEQGVTYLNNSFKTQCVINNEWRDGQGDVFTAHNPVSGDVYWQGKSATIDDVDQALQHARTAFEAWSLLDVQERIQFCRLYAEKLKENSEYVAEVITLETGKPLWESKTEVATMIGKVDLSIKSYQERTGSKQSENGVVITRLEHRPHGVVAVFGPFNFPGHLANGHIVPALIAGNAVIFKPSEQTPATAEVMVRLWQECGLPSGVLSLLHGGVNTGKAISEHDGIDGLFFTGSSAVGHHLTRSFALKPEKILALEMGGNNPLIIDQVSSVDAAVFNIIQSSFMTAGQRCTCSRRLILTRQNASKSINEKILERLISVSKNLRIGSGQDCFMGPVINRATAQRMIDVQEDLKNKGANILLAATLLDETSALISPSILDVTSVENLPDEEYFGPMLQVIWVENLEDAVRVANKTRFGLSAGIFTDNKDAWNYFYPRIRAGIVNWNRPLTGASGAAPFGGIGDSGNHRPSAYYAADYCAYPVASMLDETLELPEKLLPGVSL
ncbi:succinylglutamate-semialdehyde dehydrogenase [Sessilibacter sp. MAH1]